MSYKEKEQITAWLNKYEVENYTLKPDENYGYVVDIRGDVYLADRSITRIPIKFGHVSGNFYCQNNSLTSLKEVPYSVGRSFYCSHNQLSSLEGGPENVGGNFFCDNNQLTSLKGLPNRLGESFYCYNNSALGELQKMKNLKKIKTYLLAENLAQKLKNKVDNNKKIKL